MKQLSIALALGGVLLSAALVLWFDAGATLRAAASVGWGGFALLSLWQAAMFLVLGLAWAAVMPDIAPGLLIWSRMVRDAATNILPFSPVGGFVLGARVLTLRGVGWPVAAAGSVVDSVTEIAAQFVFTLLGLAALVALRPGSGFAAPVAIGLGVVVAGAAAVGLAREPIGRALRALATKLIGGRFGGEAKLDEMQAEMARLLQDHWPLLAGTALHLLAWVMTGASAWITLRLFGLEPDFWSIVVLEALLGALMGAAFLVPGGAGVQEAGYVGLGVVFGIAPEVALGVSLLRRARDLAFGVPILLGWQWSEVRRLRGR